MAIVPNRDGRPVNPDGRMVDPVYSQPNRNNAGTPVGSLTPSYINEVVLDTTSGQLYIAIGAANTNWTPITKVT
jgi:hypothetical protein